MERFILTVQSLHILKEITLSEQMPIIKIGTTQDSNMRAKRDLFNVPVCVTVCLCNNECKVLCDDTTFIATQAVEMCSETAAKHGDIIAIRSTFGNEPLFEISFSYDFGAYNPNACTYDAVLNIRNMDDFTIGGAVNADIRLSSKYVGSEYLNISRTAGGALIVDASHARAAATVNGMRLLGAAEVNDCNFFSIADYSFYYRNKVLYTANRDDLQTDGRIPSQPLYETPAAFEYPKLNRCPRMLYDFNTEPFEILNPPPKPVKPRENLILQLSPALAMIALTVVLRSGMIGGSNSGGPEFLIFSVASVTIGILTSVYSFMDNRKRFKADTGAWQADYAAYIADKRREIEAWRQNERAMLLDIYPSSDQNCAFVNTFSSRLFERSPRDADFLRVRAGLGAVPAIRKPIYKQEESIKTDNELMQIPAQVCADYAYIGNAPVTLGLLEAGTTGVVGPPLEQYEFFKKMLLDVCVLHDYEEVQAIVFVPPNEQKKYDWIKWLPHIKGNVGIRGIVYGDESRENVFEYLYVIMAARNAQRASGGKAFNIPYIVVFVLEEYGIKTHPLFRFAEGSAGLGICFVYFKQYAESLPQYCSEIVELSPGGGVLRRSDNKAFSRPFAREYADEDVVRFAALHLAPVYRERIELSSRLTSNISLFELLNILTPEDLNLTERWRKSNVQKSLATPLGVDAKGSLIALDLHETAHGPHGLVAGTTGSGKSEIMQSFILSAAVNFHPYEVAFVIIDFKGGGMANQFEDLPHLIGKITDIDSHEINRSLLSIRAELEKRKRLFAELGVNRIDQYIAKCNLGAATVHLPHLILIVDEFAELKAEQPEFMKELISTARVGRSLGIHLILATQKPAGQVNEQIWSNSRFKLCLKVANREDSNEVLRSPLAAEIREPGRAYLQVGSNEIFTLFQSAYSGASAYSDKSGNMREFSISEVSFTGKHTPVYEHRAKHKDGNNKTQLEALVGYIRKHCDEAHITGLPSICPPPLPESITYTPDAGARGTVVCIGMYDDPANQAQPAARLTLSGANVIIIGSAQTGKTTLLQTLLRGIAEHYSPKRVSIYILDFASKVMKIFAGLNHVGGVLTDTDDEMLKNFFKMIRNEINERKERFSKLGVSSFEAYQEMGKAPAIPHIIIMVDNLTAFKELYPDYEDAMLNICREGLALGVTVVATAKQTSGLSYRYLSNFSSRLAFNCNESGEYANVFDRCRIQPKNLQGRGLIAVNKTVYEYQAFLPFDGETEGKRLEQVRAFICKMKGKWGDKRACGIPAIPSVLTGGYWELNGYTFGDYIIPVGLTYGGIEPVTADLAHIGALGVYGRKGFGKSNLLRAIMGYLRRHIKTMPCKAYLFDGYDSQLTEFETLGFVEGVTLDAAEFEGIVQRFADAAQERMDILRKGGSLDDRPLLLCVVQNPQVFAANAVSRVTADKLKKLVNDAKLLKICFIFSNLDNNAEYSPTEIMKMTRDFPQYFLLDDIANIRLFGSSKFGINDLKLYKKPIALGDGYLYDSRGVIEKVKFLKCGREEALADI